MKYVPQAPSLQDRFDDFLEFCGDKCWVFLSVGMLFGLLHLLGGYLPQLWFADNVFFVVVTICFVGLGVFGFAKRNA